MMKLNMKYIMSLVALALIATHVDADHHFQSKSIKSFSIDNEVVITLNTRTSSFQADLNNCSLSKLKQLENVVYTHSALVKENTKVSFLSNSGTMKGCKVNNIVKL